MVERVARAIEAARYGPIDDVIWREKWARILETDPYLPRQARAAIEAMREPTEEMLDAAREYRPAVHRLTFRDAWRAMIDAALR
jgi:hypothetical protein